MLCHSNENLPLRPNLPPAARSQLGSCSDTCSCIGVAKLDCGALELDSCQSDLGTCVTILDSDSSLGGSSDIEVIGALPSAEVCDTSGSGSSLGGSSDLESSEPFGSSPRSCHGRVAGSSLSKSRSHGTAMPRISDRCSGLRAWAMDIPAQVVGLPARTLPVDKHEGKGKGKGKLGRKKPKTPEDLCFERSAASSGGMLWLRSARLQGGLQVATAVEVGNLDEALPFACGRGRIPLGSASLEVLCNRQSIFGNPFDMKRREDLRAPVLDAYAEYLQVVLCGANHVDIEGLALKRGLSREHCGKDWRMLYEIAGGADGFRRAFAELAALAAKCREHGRSLRLLCHCAPHGCHATLLARRLKAKRDAAWA